MKTYRKAKLKFTLNRIKNFLWIFARNKKGMIGVAILIFYAFIAFGAPIITPYSPTDYTPLSGQFSVPAWLQNFPGGENLSENVNPIKASDFATLESLNAWNITTTSQNIIVQQTTSKGNPYGSGAGVIAIKFRREETGLTYGTANFTIAQEFIYPYKGPPKFFIGSIAFSIQGTGDRNETVIALDVPVRISLYMQRIESEEARENRENWLGKWENATALLSAINFWTIPPISPSFLTMPLLSPPRTAEDKWKLWPLPTTTFSAPTPIMSRDGTIESVNPSWILSKESPASDITQIDPRNTGFTRGFPNALETIFNNYYLPCKYILSVEIQFLDTKYPNKSVETTVYMDDITFRTYGTAFGLLGTDQFGRDIFTQLVYGARISLYVGLLSSFLAVILGLLFGLASGYLGRVVDEVIMRFTDMLLVLPTLPLLIVLVAVLGASLNNLILILGFLGWMGFARTVRSQVLSLRERPFVEAATAIGAGKTHIIFRHILPNVMSLVYVSLATAVPGNVVAEAALSWLGFYDPNVMSWGRMLNDVQANAGGGAIFSWWWILPPGLSIALIAISFVMIGYALDEVLNPRLRIRR
ncbi:MAG: ABC transporter permease [Candidatus Bathyarchaeia archaeon]